MNLPSQNIASENEIDNISLVHYQWLSVVHCTGEANTVDSLDNEHAETMCCTGDLFPVKLNVSIDASKFRLTLGYLLTDINKLFAAVCASTFVSFLLLGSSRLMLMQKIFNIENE